MLCPACWRGTPFLTGLTCDLCGASQIGEEPDQRVICDDCIALPRPWSVGRAALAYRDTGRRLVLSLKHGDRLDLAGPAADWMLRAGRDILVENPLLVPVPIAWSRLLKRRYNQAAELSWALAKRAECEVCVDALLRSRATPSQDGRSVEGRFANVEQAIQINPNRAAKVHGRHVVLIDDVMTSGATLSVCARALVNSGAEAVNTLVLARAEKAP